MDDEHVTGAILDAALRVHTVLGPGLLENAYQACLAYELRKRGFGLREQVAMSLRYEEITLDVGYRLDMLIDERLVVELKSVEKLLPLHIAQVVSYLKLANRRAGLLLNFNTVHLRDGIRRIVNPSATKSTPRGVL